MDKIYRNGKIYMEKGGFAQALLISDGIIKAVGKEDEVLKLEADKIIDLEGKTVIPGFNDSHLHLVMTGENMSQCCLNDARSIEEVIALGKQFLLENPDLTVLVGKGWNQNQFDQGEKRLLTKADLDQISTQIPVIFDRVCIHVSSANSKAVKMLGAGKDTSIEGGEVLMGPDGTPNGIFTENGVGFLHSLIPARIEQDLERDFLKAMDYAVSVGITSVQSCDVMMSKDFARVFNVIGQIASDGRLKLRYAHQFNFPSITEFKEYLATEYHSSVYDGRMYSKGGLKLFKDGSLGGRTALLSRDYADAPGERGVEALSDEAMLEFCRLADQHQIQVITHAIGDAAIDQVLSVYEKVMPEGENPLRHGIVHNQITTRPQLEKIARLRIPVFSQPVFLLSDIPMIRDRVGQELEQTSYAFHTLYQLGAPVSLSSDAPVEDCNPFINLFAAVCRQRLDLTPEGGYFPQEKMSVEDALDAYTWGSAFNECKERFKGRLKAGYAADMVILDRDLFSIAPEQIKDIKVLETIVDGRTVYRAKGR